MSLPIYQRVAVTDAGDVIPGAEYTVINENTGVAAPIYSDRTGATLLTAPYFADSAGTIQFFIAQGTTFRVAASGGVGTYTDRYVYGVAEAVLVQADGNVGIGTSSPSGLLKTLNIDGGLAGSSIALDGGDNFSVVYTGATAGDPTAVFSNTGFKFATATAKDATGFSEKMRLDSSGNLLVGKTTTSFGAAGIEARSGGTLWATASGTNAASFNRLLTDGPIAYFSKDGTTVGSIGTNAETLYVSAPQAGGMKYTYSNATNAVMMPVTTTGANADAVHDLGYSAARFKDLYLSGGVVFDAAGGSGTGSSNTLDEYEIGTFTPTSPHVTLTSASGSYVRVGDLVHFSLVFILPASGSGTGVSINGLPFDAWNNNSNRGGVSLGYYTFSDLTSLMSVSDTTINFFIGSTVQSYSTLAGVTFYMGGTYRAA